MITRLYPNGKRKAFVLTYDDGVLQDVRLVLMLNKYGLKGTFNLNSLLMEREFVWHHEKIGPVRRLPNAIAAHLYEGHEVASHSCTHPDLRIMPILPLCRRLSTPSRATPISLVRCVSWVNIPTWSTKIL